MANESASERLKAAAFWDTEEVLREVAALEAERDALKAERAEASKAAITNQATFLREVDALKTELQACFGEMCGFCKDVDPVERNGNGRWQHTYESKLYPCTASRARERAYQREQMKRTVLYTLLLAALLVVVGYDVELLRELLGGKL